MKFTLSWLKEHLETDADLDTIVETMIRIGLEVEEVKDPAKDLADYVVAEVLEAGPHPDADKLQVLKVDNGSETFQVVCGAPNARKGLKGVFAPVGAYVPGIDLTLTKAKIRGVESFGMMCSESELELSDDHDGIIDLPSDAKVGSPAAAAIGQDDPVIDFEVTPNRPDTCGVIGVARDLAAAGLGTLKNVDVEPIKGNGTSPIDIGLTFDDATKDACPIFAGRVIKGVKNGPSPDWMQRQLRAVGLRPINALVDITNYLSFDRARPMHAYDATKITGQIHARLAKDGESFTALDGEDYTLTSDMCVIADESGVLGLGGVMGGEASGSTDATTDVFLESAYFDPLRTARTGRTSGIESDARYRFERGVDPADVVPGLDEATRLVLEICGGEASDVAVTGDVPDRDLVIEFDPAEVKRLTGMEISEAGIVGILEDLGFPCQHSGKIYLVRVPSWRPDVEGPACLVEEVARIHGFDHLPSTPLKRLNDVAKPILTPMQKRLRLARRTLATRGLSEAVTWSFIAREHAELFGGGGDEVQLSNPISSELDSMRPSLLPGLLAALGRNIDRGTGDLALFEVGPQYAGDAPEDQTLMVTGIRSGAVEGDGSARHWTGGAKQADAFDAKADAIAVLEACGAPVQNLQVVAEAPDYYHPGRSGTIRLGPKNILATFGELHPRVLEAMDVSGTAVGFEINTGNIPAPRAKGTKTKPALNASELQPVDRDFAFVVKQDVTVDKIIGAAKKADKELITDVSIFDIFEGASIGDNNKSVAFSVRLQPREKTLKDTEIDAIAQKVIAAVEKATGGTLRG